MIRTRTLLVAVISAAVFVGASASAASAGEITGNGKPTAGPAHANSICVFSGLEDGEEDPTGPSGPGTTQNWGQIPKDFRAFLTSIGENPGLACNGHLNPLKGGTTPAP